MAVTFLSRRKANRRSKAFVVPPDSLSGKKRLVISIIDAQNRMRFDPAKLRKTTEKILRYQGITWGRLSLVFVCDRRMRKLNKDFLGHDYATDVLAFDFSFRPHLRGNIKARNLDAEIIISTDTVLRQAKENQQPAERELILYICHGVLHLAGHDDHRRTDIKKMRAAEARLMRFLY